MGCFSLPWFALMRRNLVFRKRHWLSTILELILPLLFLYILVAIKNASEGSSSFESTVEPAVYQSQSATTLSFTDYVTALRAKRVCIPQTDPTSEDPFLITGISNNGYNWQVPLVKCDSRKCEAANQDALPFCEFSIIAVAGSDAGGVERANLFKTWLVANYPAIADGSPDMPFSFPLVQTFDSSTEIDDYVTANNYGTTGYPKIAMGIVWEGGDLIKYNYQLRQNSTNFNAPEEEGRPATATTPNTGEIVDSFARTDTACTPLDGTPNQGPFQNSCTGQYLYNGVLTFQRLVHDFILKQTGAADAGYRVAEAGVQFTNFPTKEYTVNGFYASIEGLGPFIVILGLLYPVATMLSYIVKEKELRQKELMKMMSVSESDIGWSWFVTFMMLHFFTATIAAVLSTSLYENSDGLLLWIFWMLTLICLVVFCMTIAATTAKTIRAVLIGLLVFFAGVFLTFAFPSSDKSTGLIQLISLHPVAAFSYGLNQIGSLEDNGVGLTWDSLTFSENKSGYSFMNTLNILFVDVFFWSFLTWYFNRVIKPDYGQAFPFYFPFTSTYWCPGKVHAPMSDTAVADKVAMSGIPCEPVSDVLKRQDAEGKSIEIHDLRKDFGEKTAVDGLNLSIYSGQITALLGHNGAGKTTLINMLTGAMGPTSGYATVAGRDIRTDLLAIRQNIGICLQHDCLFPNLTVREHLQFFSRLKGLYKKVSLSEAEAHIDQAIRDVALFEKRNSLSKNLSGGMKRKLSVAIAFCGDSKVVILDEPTSGMDPFSRRFTWNVIRQYRQDRCIVLTTHFMDEADILGDRIAIMAGGQLRCAGGALFLKKNYGVGYQLTIENKQSRKLMPAISRDDSEVFTENDDKIDADSGDISADDVKGLVKDAVPEATLLNDVGTEVRYQLPLGASGQFAGMFERLDMEVDKGNIVSYGISMTTLDEVFLLVARGDTTEENKSHLASSRMMNADDSAALREDDDEKSARSRMDLEKEALFCRHLGALFKKRAINFQRDKKAWCCTTLVPVIFVTIGFLILLIAAPTRNLSPIILELSALNPDVTVAPINPIPVNSPDFAYLCQPGTCSYQTPNISVLETNENYTFCGAQAYLGLNNLCTIDESTTIVRTLDGFQGASVVESDVETISASSYSLYNSSDEYASSQYGAIWFTRGSGSTVVGNLSNVTLAESIESQCQLIVENGLNYTTAADCVKLGIGYGFVIQYNQTGLHLSPLYQALADQALVRYAVNNPDFTITTTIAPLPITKIEEGFGQAEDVFTAWFLVVLSFPFIGGAYASFVVAERESKAKHLQTVAGVEPTAYWFSTFLWDTLNYQIPLWIIVAEMFIFKINILTTTERDVFSGVVAILFLYGPASAGFAYCWSFAFTSPSLCAVFLIVTGFLIGFGGPLTTFILILIGSDPSNPKDNLVSIADALTWILRFTPSFCLGKGLFFAINIDAIAFVEQDLDLSVWSEPVLLGEVIALVLQGIFYTLLAIVLDISSTNPRVMGYWRNIVEIFTCRRLCAGDKALVMTIALDEDDDVIAEQDRVLTGEANSDLIVLSQLSKIYSNGKVAVNNLSLGIPHGQCFGLLGINGAGKTTTMGMLTAEFPPSSGDATLAGFSITKEPGKIRRRIGYCPQFDAHFAQLSGRNHVELYASIKGIPNEFVKEAAARKLEEVGLSEYDSDRLCVNYSGGMKRRLSLACATIGQPQLVFLDECSTGVDPVARREIWQLVSDMVTGGNIPEKERTSVILTTHSMEECEALCPRIGIMANGRLRCLGSAQHLKNKFGKGYQVEMKTRIADRDDEDYIYNASSLATSISELSEDVSSTELSSTELFFNYEQAVSALKNLTGDDFLSTMVTEHDPNGYTVWKDSMSPVGVPLDGLAAFATSELRMRKVASFVSDKFPVHVLRERQDTKARYEVNAAGFRISNIFALIEENKDELRLADYGVSQTSLEQVFNMHAAEAEKLKEGRDDH